MPGLRDQAIVTGAVGDRRFAELQMRGSNDRCGGGLAAPREDIENGIGASEPSVERLASYAASTASRLFSCAATSSATI